MTKTREEYNAYMAAYMTARYHKRRNTAIEQLGGKCADCGSTERLEFDHEDASTKKYDMGKIFSTGSKQKVADELAKCALRCTDCHKAKGLREQDQGQVGHGEGLTGRRNCLCDLCRPLKNKYSREWKQRNKLGL